MKEFDLDEAILNIGKRGELNARLKTMKTWRDRWPIIEAAYKHFLPEILARGENVGTDPNFINWPDLFSPIESVAWGELRGQGVPMYPQFPVGGVFVDFANPVQKIGLELDGKEYHSPKKDRKRDEMLGRLGWYIYRIGGKECHSDIKHPEKLGMSEDEPRYRDQLSKWILGTCEGVIFSIKQLHFTKEPFDESYEYCHESLRIHNPYSG